MLSPLICGSFQDQEEDDFEFLNSCSLAQKPSKKETRWHSFGGRSKKEQHNKNKNPYADRGLDKFSALLAELDSKRQKIYTQKGSEDISLLGFVYSNTDDYKPIVVRLKKKQQQQPDRNKLKKIQEKFDKPKTEAIENNNNNNNNNGTKNIDKEPKQYARVQSNVESDRKSSQTNIRLLWSKIKLEKLSRPGYYVPVIMILILVFLVFFGRSFAILCTTLGWHFIPNIQEHKSNGSNLKNMKTLMKKNYVKAFSYNNKMVSSGGGDEHRDLRKTKTMQKDYVKALSYNNNNNNNNTNNNNNNNNNNNMMVSSNDDGLSSPTSVLTGIKSPPQRWP